MKIAVAQIVLGALAMVLCSFVLGTRFQHWMDDPPPAVAAQGTVERRIHLKMEGPYDTDKPRRFVCREEP